MNENGVWVSNMVIKGETSDLMLECEVRGCDECDECEYLLNFMDEDKLGDKCGKCGRPIDNLFKKEDKLFKE